MERWEEVSRVPIALRFFWRPSKHFEASRVSQSHQRQGSASRAALPQNNTTLRHMRLREEKQLSSYLSRPMGGIRRLALPVLW